MKILLLIGKVLGFGLLGILGLLLLILFLLLFLPICYDIEGIYEEKKALRVRLYDAFRIFSFSLVQDGADGSSDLRVLWMHLMQDEEEDEDVDEEESEEVAKMPVDEASSNAPLPDSYFEEEASHPLKPEETKPKKPKKKKEKAASEPKEQKDDLLDKIRRLLEDEEAKAGITVLLHELAKFLRRLAPKRYRFRGEFYTGDPATTGQITGFLATIPWLQPRKDNYLLPDFSREEFYLYGRMGIAGSIQLVCVVGMALRIFFNRNVRKLYAYFKEND
ncbi:MAG: hypothetical protein II571_00905 [Lachnospiraceae bacterium]|nr:hypothetical protein [Lachnospiraceae bacterium]MBQ2577969.1 hypothetical protein [Lachnospiraceae bacterium]MBQ4372530.1 hypothetical protein [Lachnospiraceae bacterium]MBR0429937.1 hypothetical protein [Lachnospiraceae bacterium]